ncbi:heat-shock protein Hsp20 [Fibrobacteria bacterium R8-3-H12]
MTLTNYSPVHNLNRVFDSLMDYARGEEAKAYTPKSYLTEKDGVYTLEVELPGVKKEDIHIDVESNLLKISAIRKREDEEYKYEREYHLSNEVDSANIKASSENGILTLVLSRKPEAQSKRIEIA